MNTSEQLNGNDRVIRTSWKSQITTSDNDSEMAASKDGGRVADSCIDGHCPASPGDCVALHSNSPVAPTSAWPPVVDDVSIADGKRSGKEGRWGRWGFICHTTTAENRLAPHCREHRIMTLLRRLHVFIFHSGELQAIDL